MADSVPWLYRYATERGRRRGRDILRPVVTLSIPGSLDSMAPSWALVDTGAENVLAADWLADFAGVDLSVADRVMFGLGGQVVEVAFAEVELRLHAPDSDEVVAWRADVGFVPRWQAPFPIVAAQLGFLDQFTLTFHRGAAMLAVEPLTAFDDRFGSPT